MKKLLMIISLFLFFGCSGMAQDEGTGGIYGDVYVYDAKEKQYIDPSLAKFTIDELGITINADTGGYFYFDDVPEGNYTIIGEVEGAQKITLRNISVEKDRISLFYEDCFSFKRDKNKPQIDKDEDWKGINVDKVGLNERGVIKGYIYDEIGKGMKAFIITNNNIAGCVSDSTGYFELKNIFPSVYRLKFSKISYIHKEITNVIVLPQKMSIVNVNMEKDIGASPITVKWEPKYE